MQKIPFTKAQADEICEDFEDMKDTEFKMGNLQYIVEDIVICPSAEPYRQRFTEAWLNTRAFQHNDYPLDDYDVLLFVCDIATEEFLFIDIRDYIAEKVFNYNFPS